MGLLIDASILIEYERGRLDLTARVTGREDEEFMVSVVTASELLHGVHRARDAATRRKRAAFVEAVLARFPLLPVEVDVARVHARLWADLAAEGKLIGAHDLWLGATCIAHDLIMVAANRREFDRIPELQIEDWSAS